MYLLPSSVLPTLFTQMVDVLQISVGLFRLGKRWTLLFLPNKTSRWGQGWFSPTSSPLCSDSQIKSWCETLHSGIMWRDVAHLGFCIELRRWLSAHMMLFPLPVQLVIALSSLPPWWGAWLRWSSPSAGYWDDTFLLVQDWIVRAGGRASTCMKILTRFIAW